MLVYTLSRSLCLKAACIAALLLSFSLPTWADTSCSAGSVCTVQLTQSNTLPQMAGIQVTVTIDNTGPTTVLSFQVTSNPLAITPVGIVAVGWTGASAMDASTAYASSASTNFGGVQALHTDGLRMNGFGTFPIQAHNSASTGGVSSAITFTLNGLVTNFVANANGNSFAVELFYTEDCHPFVSGPNPSEEHHNNPACVPAAVIPEPATLSLFGSGLLAIGAFLRRRFRKL